MKKSKKIFLAVILFLYTIVAGVAGWIIVAENGANLGQSAVSDAVCYYTNSSGTTKKYTRIEKALEDANKEATSTSKITVYVNEKKNPTIYKNCTIGSYVTLCLPYQGTTYYVATDKNATNYNWGSSSTFADNNPDDNRINQVTIASGVTMTVNGNLQIGGIFGKNKQGISGIPNSLYCEILLKSNAKIISNGYIECYGFIKEEVNDNGSRLELKSGKMKLPFAIYDFKGGSITTACYREDVSPFAIYDIPNIQTLFRIHAGAVVNAEYRFEMSSSPYSGDLTFIGSTNAGLIIQTGYLDMQYTSETSAGTSTDAVVGQTIVNLYGKMDVGTIQLSVGGYNMDSADWFFPIPYKFKFIVKQGSVMSASSKVKFLPGSEVVVDYGGTVNINNQVIFYPDGYVQTTRTYNYPDNLEAAKITNNGTLVINNSGALGLAGDINVINLNNSKEAIIEVYNNSSVSSKDDVSGNIISHTANVTFTGTPFANVTSDSSTATRTKLNGSIYEGVQLSSGGYGWKQLSIGTSPITINYYSVYEDGTKEAFTGHGNVTTSTPQSSVSLSTPTKDGYVFLGWYLDEEGEDYINNGQLSGLTLFRKSTNGVLNVYAHWEKGASVNIKYVLPDGTSIPGIDFNYQSTPGATIELYKKSETTISSDNSTSPTSKTKCTFTGWSIDGTDYLLGDKYKIPEDAADGSDVTITAKASVTTYYKLYISGTFDYVETFTISEADINGSSSVSLTEGSIYLKADTVISVKIKSGSGWSQERTTCTLTGTNFVTAETNSISVSRGYAVLGYYSKSVSDTIKMPSGAVTVTFAHE